MPTYQPTSASAASEGQYPVVEQKPHATYQDVIDAPEHKIAEIIDGTLYLRRVTPSGFYAVAYSSILGLLFGPYHKGRGGPGDWWILGKIEIHLKDDILVPDFSGWRHERMPTLRNVSFPTLPPDWVCDILSPSTRELILQRKLPVYAREGVRHLWLLDPEAHTLETFELRQDGKSQPGDEWIPIASLRDNDPVSVSPFDAVTFKLDDLWIPEHAIQKSSPNTEKPKGSES